MHRLASFVMAPFAPKAVFAVRAGELDVAEGECPKDKNPRIGD